MASTGFSIKKNNKHKILLTFEKLKLYVAASAIDNFGWFLSFKYALYA